jgi:hypothetical protein
LYHPLSPALLVGVLGSVESLWLGQQSPYASPLGQVRPPSWVVTVGRLMDRQLTAPRGLALLTFIVCCRPGIHTSFYLLDSSGWDRQALVR